MKLFRYISLCILLLFGGSGYSQKLISSGNNLVKVGNNLLFSSFFLPSDLSNLFQWIDLGSGVTLNGSDVSAITDRSGNSHNIDQTTGSQQPLFIASDQNGKPSMQFDGVSESIISTEASSVWKFLHDSNDWTIYTVLKITDANPDNVQTIFNTNDAGSINVGIQIRYDDRSGSGKNDRIVTFISKGSAGNNIILDNSVDNVFTTQAYHILTSIYDFNNVPNWETLVDNVQASTANNANLPHSAADPTETLEIAKNSGGQFLKGSISEWFIYDRLLTAGENTQVINYINTKYDL